ETKSDNISDMVIKNIWGNSIFETCVSEALGNYGGLLCVWDPYAFHKEHHIISDKFIALYGTWRSNQSKMLLISVYAPQAVSLKRGKKIGGVQRSTLMVLEFLISSLPRHVSLNSIGRISLYVGSSIGIKNEQTGSLLGGFNLMVTQTWNSITLNDNNVMIRFKKKLQILKKEIREANDDLLASRMELLNQLHDFKTAETSEYIQKAKIKWTIEGDENSKFFHGMVNRKRANLAVKGVMIDGEWVDEPNRVKQEFCDYFAARFNEPNTRHGHINYTFPNRLNKEQVADLETPITRDEIRLAVWGCGENKSPGPDGFTFEFFRKFWVVVGPDFCTAVEWPDGYTATFYKSAWSIIGKEVCQAVKEFFLNGKLLGEVNATLISLVPKIPTPDKEILEMFGFHKTMVSSIITCVTSTKFSINLNGERVGYLKGGRGLRQEDPISPYLFTLVMEVLNMLIPKNIKKARDLESVKVIKKSLDEFSRYSGLLPNLQKSIYENGNKKKFKISNVWKDMNCQEEKVDWHHLVWFAQSIPRHAFVTWIAIQERLMTQDKLMLWRPNEELKCALCSKCKDSHNHLFFTCEFSIGIWNELLNLLNVRLSESWDQIISKMKALPLNKNIWSIVRRIVCKAAIYYIWQERNNKILKNEKRDKDTIFNIIKETIVMKLIGLRVKESITVNEVEENCKVKLQRG
nr:RNA-directed DNA polymerase, eukaryota, reverse transcriptase zinc-binding domain protein [Tanacetum cinerariifolium]